jgi:hypothetical protein
MIQTKVVEKNQNARVGVWRTRFACWIRKATNTHAEYVIHFAFPLQQWLHERPSTLRYTYIACLVEC